jgi:hypothetical protein
MSKMEERLKILNEILKKLSEEFEVEIICYPRELIRKQVKPFTLNKGDKKNGKKDSRNI